MSDKSQSPPQRNYDDHVDDRSRSRSKSPLSAKAQSSPRDRSERRSMSPNRRNTNDVDPEVANPGNNLYVANLPTRVAQDELIDVFSKFGRVEKCEIISDPQTRESRGFAFVTFEDSRDAADAVKELDGFNLNGRSLKVQVAKRNRGHQKTPGKYLGPRLASSKYRDGGRNFRDDRYGRSRSRERRRSRSRSRDRGHSRRYDDRDRYERRNTYDRDDKYDRRRR